MALASQPHFNPVSNHRPRSSTSPPSRSATMAANSSSPTAAKKSTSSASPTAPNHICRKSSKATLARTRSSRRSSFWATAALAVAGGTHLLRFKIPTMETAGETNLPAPLEAGPYPIGDALLVATADENSSPSRPAGEVKWQVPTPTRAACRTASRTPRWNRARLSQGHHRTSLGRRRQTARHTKRRTTFGNGPRRIHAAPRRHCSRRNDSRRR